MKISYANIYESKNLFNGEMFQKETEAVKAVEDFLINYPLPARVTTYRIQFELYDGNDNIIDNFKVKEIKVKEIIRTNKL